MSEGRGIEELGSEIGEKIKQPPPKPVDMDSSAVITRGKGTGAGRRGERGLVVTERDLTGQCTRSVIHGRCVLLQNCALETGILLLTNATPIHSIKF